MIKIDLRHNFPAVARQLDKLPEAIANKAMARALNETMDQGKTQMASQISKEFRVKVGDVKKRLRIERARFKGELRLWASLSASREGARGMNLINFVVGGQPKRTKKGGMRQLNFQIKRDGGRKQIAGAFIATNKKTGGTAVFVREGKGRYPIKTMTTIDIPQMFNTRRVNDVVRAVMLNRFERNFNRELRGILKGYAR